MADRDHYKVLGVEPDASQDEIRKAYRRLAKEHHPDRQGGSKAAEERFKEIAEAYGVLGDPEKRKQYDRLRELRMHGGPFSGFGQGMNVDFGDGTAGFGNLGDIFSSLFGGGRSRAERAPRQRGRDMYSVITIPFETAARGGKVEVTIQGEMVCSKCSGSGAASGSKVETCPQCRGTGQALSGQGAFSVAHRCPACFGRGKIIQKPCRKCQGAGSVDEPSVVSVSIPTGIEDGKKMRLAGMGEPGVGGGPAGDLLLEVRVQPHPKFERKGRNLYSTVEIDMVEAALGCDVDVQTLHEFVTLKVPAGIQPGQKLRVAGHGLETSDGRKGDHFVEVRVRIPRDLTEEQRRLLEQLRRAPAATGG